MNTEQLIAPSVPALQTEDTGYVALALMEENSLHQLPVVVEEHYMALVSESDLLDWITPDKAISESDFLQFKPAISAHAHPFEAMRLMHEMHLSVLPVIDAEQKYCGCITKDTLLKYLAETSGLNQPGGIVILEILPRNYTLYEIARICENEDVIITNAQVNQTENGMLEVTLKLNRTSIEAVVSSFERHNYLVKEVYGEMNEDHDIVGKYNLLMNYINM